MWSPVTERLVLALAASVLLVGCLSAIPEEELEAPEKTDDASDVEVIVMEEQGVVCFKSHEKGMDMNGVGLSCLPINQTKVDP